MTKSRIQTKERLLEAASQLFAAKGFHNATVAEICTAADANIAAVNYHFGDKERLYDQVWRRAFLITSTTYPIEADCTRTCSPEEALYTYALAILQRIFSNDEAGLFAKLLCREMADPTLALEKIADEALQPQSERIDAVLSNVLGPDFNLDQQRLSKLSIIGQCAFYNFSSPLRTYITGKTSFSAAEIEVTARHIAQFSLGGLEKLKQQTRNSRS